MVSLSEKITYLNRITLECLSEPNEKKILEKLAETGIKTLGADFGFVWLKQLTTDPLKLIYKRNPLSFNLVPLKHSMDSNLTLVIPISLTLLSNTYILLFI